MSVAMDVDRLASRWARGTESTQRWLVLDGIDLPQARHAVGQANGTELDAEDDEDIGGSVAPTVGGSAVEVLYCEDREMVRRWLLRLREALDDAGSTGQVRLEERPWDGPAEFADDRSVPTAFFAWRLHDPPLAREDWREHWGVDAPLTAWVMRRVATWSRDVAGRTTLEIGGGPASGLDPGLSAEDVAERLVDAIGAARFITVTITPHGTGTGGRIGFGMGGICVVQLIGVADRHHGVQALRDELVDVASHLRWGAIRLASDGQVDHSSLYGKAGLPGGLVGGTQVARAGRLLSEWVPDAHGIQVLGDGHLGRLRLSSERWRTTRLDGGRSLVEARHLDPWFGDSIAGSDVLAEARREFSPVQLTAEALLAARRSGPLI